MLTRVYAVESPAVCKERTVSCVMLSRTTRDSHGSGRPKRKERNSKHNSKSYSSRVRHYGSSVSAKCEVVFSIFSPKDLVKMSLTNLRYCVLTVTDIIYGKSMIIIIMPCLTKNKEPMIRLLITFKN